MNSPVPKIVPVPSPVVPGPRPCVLVVDDSRVIRSAIKKILDSDFEVVLAESGDVAWGLLERDQKFQMLVTDIEMPGIDGYELICRVRGSDQPQLKDIPVLTITGAEDEQTKERAFACGATDFITKPLDGLQLKARALSYVRLDQSARDLAEKATQLEEQAINDPLTNLRSRRYFLQRGVQDLAFCMRNHKDLTVVRFDIDRYKDIYRKVGEDVGDGILSWLAGVVSTSARVEDTVARVAGAKFAVLASSCGIDEARRFCERLREAVRTKPFQHNGEAIELTLSFGLACFSQERAQHIEPLLNLADERVNRAVLDGGNRICVSVLGEATPNIEEVVLDVPLPAETTALAIPALALEPAVAAPALSELPALSDLDELEMPSVEQSPLVPESSVASASPATPDTLAQLVSIDKALQMIASGQSKLLEPYLKLLGQQLRPLLDLLARRKD